MDLRDLFFSFNGRIGRKTYFLSKLLLISIGLLTVIFASSFMIGLTHGGIAVANSMSLILVIFLFIVSFLLAVGNIALIVKRFHDLNQSGWIGLLLFFFIYLITSVIPPVGYVMDLILNFILFLVVGTYGKNRFGEDPILHKEIT